MLNMRELDEMARAILRKMLSADFPGAAELREQADSVRVLRREDGWNDISLEVSSTARRAPVVYERPVELSWPGLRSPTGLDADLTLVLEVYEGLMVEITWLAIEYDYDYIPPLEACRVSISDGVGRGRYADGKS